MDKSRAWPVAVALLLVVAACHRQDLKPPGEPASSPPAASSAPAGDDYGSFLRAYESTLEYEQSARPEDLSLGINVIAWLARENEEAWEKIAPRVRTIARNSAQVLPVPVRSLDAARAATYHTEGEKPENAARSEELFRRAALLNPKSADYINHLSVAASKRKDFAKGERYALLAMAIDHSFIGAYQELAYALKNLKRYEECVEVAARGLDLPEGDLHTKALLLARQGQAWWMLGKEDEARRAFLGSAKIGGPEWVRSYLDGKQVLGKEYVEPAN